MKIVTIMGSPRKKGNTAALVSLFEERVAKDHEVERIDIIRHDVGGCVGCYKCQERLDEPGCVRKDDAPAIFEKMIAADGIVYATPLYCWSFTSQLKPLIDRHFCLVKGYGTPDHDSLLCGKPAALLVTCAGPIEGNCDAIQSIFAGLSEYVKLGARGNFILPFCTTPDDIGDKGVEVAERIAGAITR